MDKRRLNPLRKLAREESGVALTEFALIAPVLFLVLFGMLDFGRAINYWNDETQIASAGARFAVVSGNNGIVPGNCLDGTTPATLAKYIQCQADTNELRNGSSSVSKAQVCISAAGGGAVGQPVKVNVSTNFNWIPFIGSRIGVVQTKISGTATMRLEKAWATAGTVCS